MKHWRLLLVCVVAIVWASLLVGSFFVGDTKALFIGNALLLGSKGSGVCASAPNRDYYALVNAALDQDHYGYAPTRISGTKWERAVSESAQNDWLTSISPRLESGLDYVIIQLGDNIGADTLPLFEAGMDEFIDRVQQSCPGAKIVWAGAWFSSPEKQLVMKTVCARQGIKFVDIRSIVKKRNQSYVGAEVTYRDGSSAIITDQAVAQFPGDAGMALIADGILTAVGRGH
jgi:hypothetical protein